MLTYMHVFNLRHSGDKYKYGKEVQCTRTCSHVYYTYDHDDGRKEGSFSVSHIK